MALLNAFMNHPGGVNIRIESLAASMASVLAMGGKKVEAYQNTMMMIHNSWVCAAGNRIELLEVADILEKVDGNILSTYTGKTKIGKREMADMMAAETWMNAKEMKEKGFIDTILESGKAVKAEFDLSVFANCPDGLRGENHEATEREKERVLRDVVGLSVKEAKAFLAGRRGGEGIDELAAELKKILSIFGG
jgi:ATP-dependent Clp protease protease subunit